MSEPIRVLVVDDHALFASSLEIRLGAEDGIRPLPSAVNAEQALERCRAEFPDVVLMDIDLPGMGGVEATAQILQMCPRTRIIALSGLRDPQVLTAVIEAGACAIVPKTRALDDLVEAIRQAAAGIIVLPEAEDAGPVAEPMAGSVRGALGVATPAQLEMDRRFSELTPAELDLLKLFVQGLSTIEAAARLGVSPTRVRARADTILKRLHVRSRRQAVVIAREYGVTRLTSPG